MTIVIDGETFNVPIEGPIVRRFDFLDKYAERTEDGVLHRELIGVYKNYELKFGNPDDPAEYDRLIEKLSEPEEFHTVVVPDSVTGGTFSFTAYFSNVRDELRYSSGSQNYWTALTVNFIAESPARTP